MSLPLNELRELRPEDREHLICGFREARLASDEADPPQCL
jgi:hypothetical protein